MAFTSHLSNNNEIKASILHQILLSPRKILLFLLTSLRDCSKIAVNSAEITSVVTTFAGLVSLRTLDLSHNKIEKLDNKTNSLLEDCLSLETVSRIKPAVILVCHWCGQFQLNLSHNRISFITRKTFPSNPYFPYKLKEVDLSYNSMPVVTFDLVFGTSKLEKLNLSHNVIGDIRKGKFANLVWEVGKVVASRRQALFPTSF